MNNELIVSMFSELTHQRGALHCVSFQVMQDGENRPKL
jgi:hypothetical protein